MFRRAKSLLLALYHAHALGMFEDCSSCPSDPDADAGVCWFVCLLVRGVDLVGDSALTVLLVVPVIRAFHISPDLTCRNHSPPRTIGKRLQPKIFYTVLHARYTYSTRAKMKTSPSLSPSWTPNPRTLSRALRPAEPPTVVEYIYEISTANDGTAFLQAYPQNPRVSEAGNSLNPLLPGCYSGEWVLYYTEPFPNPPPTLPSLPFPARPCSSLPFPFSRGVWRFLRWGWSQSCPVPRYNETANPPTWLAVFWVFLLVVPVTRFRTQTSRMGD